VEDVISQLLLKSNWLVLTGAGVSAESGVPTYRDKQGNWQRKPPVMYQEFVKNHEARQRFWLRNMAGWRFMKEAEPNSSHRYLVDIEKHNKIKCLITQNVDGLHQRAGSNRVIDLHGRIDTVGCLSCCSNVPRSEIQDRLERYNPSLSNSVGKILPDGDADIDDIDFFSMKIPDCSYCNGILKPNVVFFGDSIPKQRLVAVSQQMDLADGLLVLGSSLAVYSGYRICLAASRQGKPIVIVNQGITRADHIASVKSEDRCEPILKAWHDALIS
jgi:NAD-dependent SIR2 family protein deacetylase